MKFDHIGIFVRSLLVGRDHFKNLLNIADESEEYHDDILKVSIIVPTLNEALIIEESLAAIACLNPHEIIVVDGGSDDAHFRCEVIDRQT